jgi:hypothetical protein
LCSHHDRAWRRAGQPPRPRPAVDVAVAADVVVSAAGAAVEDGLQQGDEAGVE